MAAPLRNLNLSNLNRTGSGSLDVIWSAEDRCAENAPIRVAATLDDFESGHCILESFPESGRNYSPPNPDSHKFPKF